MRLRDIQNIGSKEGRRRIIAVDDEQGILDSLNVFLSRNGYEIVGVTNPQEAIELVKKEYFDLMLLDFLMEPLHGDQVIEEIRKFNKELYIILLTGHKDLAPPLDTIRRLQIQGYCEKSDKMDQLLLLVESGMKSVEQLEKITKINKQLQIEEKQLKQAYMDSIEILRRTVEAKDIYTRGHSDRVSKYSVIIAKKMGLPEEEIETIRVGGLFHDIGKIGVPDHILLKNSRLTDEEYSQIKSHPDIGVHILGTAEIFNDILDIVQFHHERYDGKGYPKQLKGDEIPLHARICAVADTFDAITSSRAYRAAFSIQHAIDEIGRCIGTQFHEEPAQAFIDIWNEDPAQIEEIYKTQKANENQVSFEDKFGPKEQSEKEK